MERQKYMINLMMFNLIVNLKSNTIYQIKEIFI